MHFSYVDIIIMFSILQNSNRKMRRQLQEMTEDMKDRDVEIEELKFRINSEQSAMTEVKDSIDKYILVK